ncbi:MAG: VOC family protein [bacterium]
MSTSQPADRENIQRAQPESFRGRTIMVSLTVKDVPTSVAWYRDVVGFTVIEEHQREGKLMAVSVAAGAVRILLGQDDGARGFDRTKGEGFSLMITTAQNVDDIANRIKQQGGTLESEPADMPWGARVFRLKDPDGFRLVIASER